MVRESEILFYTSNMITQDSVIDINDLDYNVCVSYGDEPKSVITVYINQANNQLFDCYVYSIANSRTKQIYSTILQNTEDNNLFDLTKNLSTLLVRKYDRPAYVNLNGRLSLQDYSLLSSAVMKLIHV